MPDIHNTPETPHEPHQSSRLRQFYDNYKSQIMTYGVLTVVVLIFVFVLVPGIKHEEIARAERAQQFIAERPTAAEADYRLPSKDHDWFLEVEKEYFLCNRITLIPLQNRTTVINEYGNYIDPSGSSVSISSTTEKTPNRCWSTDRDSFTQTSYYEFSDCTCLVIAEYQRASNLEYDDLLSWQESAITTIPTEWRKIS